MPKYMSCSRRVPYVHEIFMSPFTVAVAGCLMILGLGVFGIYSEMDQRRVRSQERMTLARARHVH